MMNGRHLKPSIYASIHNMPTSVSLAKASSYAKTHVSGSQKYTPPMSAGKSCKVTCKGYASRIGWLRNTADNNSAYHMWEEQRLPTANFCFSLSLSKTITLWRNQESLHIGLQGLGWMRSWGCMPRPREVF